jgi:hypothetical protein
MSMSTDTTTVLQRTLEPGGVADAYVNDLCAQRFYGGVEREGFRYVRALEVERASCRLGALEAFGEVELSWSVDNGQDAVLGLPGGELALLIADRGTCEIVVAGHDDETVAREAARLGDALREEAPRIDELTLRFWALDCGGARAVQRRLDAPAWDEIHDNYPARVRGPLAKLMRARGPASGTVLLWHGAPGGGKTTALRALARAWRDWCSIHYITDPEQFLRGSSYLMHVATDDPDSDRWRLIVLEDAGELMAADARAEVGQGLSRVLNLTDGMLGRGQKCLLLVTTNEPVKRLHPALRRPGRCWAELDFRPFTPREASAWLARRGRTGARVGTRTLAELYALLEDRPLETAPTEPFGFSRALTR